MDSMPKTKWKIPRPGFLNALRGIGGEYELNRVVGALGGVAYIGGANIFIAWSMVKGYEFDLVVYCTAFPAGLAVVVGSIAGAVTWKDKGVASAKVIESTRTPTAPRPLEVPQEALQAHPADEPSQG